MKIKAINTLHANHRNLLDWPDVVLGEIYDAVLINPDEYLIDKKHFIGNELYKNTSSEKLSRTFDKYYFEVVEEITVVPEKPQYNFFDFEMVATYDCDDTLVLWSIGNNTQPYELWSFEEQQKCSPEDVVRIEDPYKLGDFFYLVKHNRHIKLLQDYKTRGFGVVVWSAGGVQWAKAVTNALGLKPNLVMAKPNRHIDDMPCTSWMGERVYIPKDKH